MSFKTGKFRRWLNDRVHFGRAKLGFTGRMMRTRNNINLGKAQAFELVLKEFEKNEYWQEDIKSNQVFVERINSVMPDISETDVCCVLRKKQNSDDICMEFETNSYSFEEVEKIMQGMIEVLQRRLDSPTKCPFHPDNINKEKK